MINEIRTYFKSVIKEVEPDLKEHKEYYTSSNIPDSKIEDTYFLKIGNMSGQRIDNNYTATFDVTLEIWKNGDKDIITKLDKAYCNAIEIMTNLQDQRRLTQLEFMKEVSGVSIENEAIESNDNAGKFTLNFNVLVSYDTNN
tara:strand:- start:345 stop:770 length:426 start_codon:yes stop_codon:yes gene_type:complete